MPTLDKQQQISQYKVAFPIKDSTYAETFRVKDATGKNFFLKLFNYAKLHCSQFDENGNVLELVISKQLRHHNLTKYHDCGELLLNNKQFAYIVYDFIVGETVAQKTTREKRCSVYNAKQIVSGVLQGLQYLHSLPTPILHNELTTDNVMLDTTNGNHPILIDFGYASFLQVGRQTARKEHLNPFYLAPEAFNGIFTPQTDIFSVGIMLYHLLFGFPPHSLELSSLLSNKQGLEDALAEARNRPLNIPNAQMFELNEQLINTIAKATATNPDDRFQTADEFLKALNGDIKLSYLSIAKTATETPKNINIRRGNGFADVIGLDELKEKLQFDVIDLIRNPEEAKKWGIDMPNGLLFYGPPGCGKTYFAEKFAEEAGCNFMSVHCSDIASPYIHGGQTKIAEVFKQARDNAPTILFMDEIEAMITDRQLHNNVSESGEVNEFLTQLNNCGKERVLVIGATNIPTKIDKAALRAGRLELKYYIPQPDSKTRQGLFELYLRNTKADFGIDYEHLASLTENYVSAEIKLVVDEAVRQSRRQNLRYVTQAVIEEIIKGHKNNLTKQDIQKYEDIRREFEGIKEERRRIGFQ